MRELHVFTEGCPHLNAILERRAPFVMDDWRNKRKISLFDPVELRHDCCCSLCEGTKKKIAANKGPLFFMVNYIRAHWLSPRRYVAAILLVKLPPPRKKGPSERSWSKQWGGSWLCKIDEAWHRLGTGWRDKKRGFYLRAWLDDEPSNGGLPGEEGQPLKTYVLPDGRRLMDVVTSWVPIEPPDHLKEERTI